MKSIHVFATLVGLALAPSAIADVSPSTDPGLWEDDFERSVKVETPDGNRRLARVSYEVPVDVSPDKVWALLADYGAVQDHFPAIVDSDYIGSSDLGEGTARFCDIDFNGRAVHVKERILEIEHGAWFTYDVYEARNFPLNTMRVGFGVRVDEAGQTFAYNIIDYRLKPAAMTGLLRGNMRNSARSTVLAIKHVLETGEQRSGDELDQLYPSL